MTRNRLNDGKYKKNQRREKEIERETWLKQWPGSPLIRIMFLKYFLTSSVHAAQTCAVSMWQHWNRSYAIWLKTSSHIVLASQRFVEWCVMKFPIIDMFNWSRCTFLWPFHSCGCDYYFNVMLLSSDLSKKFISFMPLLLTSTNKYACEIFLHSILRVALIDC